MVDSINSGAGSQISRANKGPSAPTARQASDSSATAATPAPQTTASVDVQLSNEIRSSESATFDEAKVREMRQAIESGSFPLDSRRIAENFAELERLI